MRFSILAVVAFAGAAVAQFPFTALNITALVGKNNASAFECWSLIPGFLISNQTGTAGAIKLELGNLSNGSYSILPPGFNGGLHNAPANQWVAFMSGLARIELPTTHEVAFIVGGARGLLFAADIHGVAGDGHITTYPSNEYTRALQIPTPDGAIPNHTVLHDGPCTAAESQ